MAIQNIEIINNNRNVSETIPLKAIVNSHMEQLKYTRYQKDNEVSIAYVESEEITSLKNLSVLERHWERPENNTSLLEDFEFLNIYDQKVFYSEYKKLLISDRVYIDRHGQERPLFYKHKMKGTPTNVEFYSVQNKTKSPIEEGYAIDEISNNLFTNYQNYFDYNSGSYRLFYVNYTVDGISYNELLNPEPAIDELSEDSLNTEGLIIKDSYTSEKIGSQYKFEIFLSESFSSRLCTSDNGFYIKPLEANEIKILKPESIYLDNPWYLRITNGEFVSGDFSYSIPEYYFQEFTNEFGVIRLVDKDSYFVTERVVKLPVERIKYNNQDNFYIDVIIMDEEENLIKVISTDPTKEKKTYQKTGIQYTFGGISSVDENKGFIELEESISKNNIIKCSFFYRTNELYYNLVDFNPVNNRKLLDHKYVIYCKPNTSSPNRSIYYLLVDRENIIVETSDPEFRIYTADGNANLNTAIRKELVTFEEENPALLFLGEVSIEETSQPKDLFVFNINETLRVNESEIQNSIKRNHRILQSDFMYGEDGQKIQRNNIASIDVPIELLQEYSEEEIKRFLNNRISIDRNYILNFVYPKSSLELNVNEDNNIEIKMSWEGAYTYKVYRNSSTKGRYETPIYEETVAIRPVGDVVQFVDTIPDENKTANEVYYYTVRLDEYPVGNIFGIKRV